MRGLALMLLVLAILVGGGRLFTGVIYHSDEPTALLVLKPRPATWIERAERDDPPSTRRIVLDREEPTLFYGRLYVSLMRTAPFLVPGLAVGAMLLLIVPRRRLARRRD